MSFSRVLLLSVALSASPSFAFPVPSSSSIVPVPILKWGATGHSIVAAIATSLLNANATATAKTLLPANAGDLTAIASWADDVRRTEAYKWSAPLHFINSPDWACNYNRARDCVGEDGELNWCVDGAIQNYTSRLADSTLSSDDSAEALKFIVHFVGDIHQPLHVGFTTDEGGNTYKGTFEGSSVNLHEVWDTTVIDTRMTNDFNGDQTQYTQSLITRVAQGGDYSKLVAQWNECTTEQDNTYGACSIDWADQSIDDACQYSYVEADGSTHIADGFDLEADYYQRVMPIIEIQLAKGGVRLAKILNNLFPDSTKKQIAHKLVQA